ncbi:MAG TPA: hypothetical protein PLM82_13055 [Candidatus Latescibacteria bacterium]|nr:hypothetical protein [Candidatus Latescibacterota bacterium]
MTRRISVLFACFFVMVRIGFSEISESTKESVANMAWEQCSKYSKALFSTNVPFASLYSSARPKYDITFKENGLAFVVFMFDGYPGYWCIPKNKKRGVLVSVANCISVSYDAKNNRIHSINNGLLLEHLKPDTTDYNTHTNVWVDKPPLYEKIKTTEADSIPTLSIVEASERAKRYLDVLDISLPANHVLYSARFNSDPGKSPFSWILNWGPPDSEYKYDDHPVSFEVIFHEKYGLLHARPGWIISRPSSVEVNISREQAIFKAEKAVPLVMQTPFYQRCCVPGFRIKGVKSVELLISRPNWLLDPSRAVWGREPPTDETRLCWVIVFETLDTVLTRPRNFKPIPPDIRIYIDAATGEIVGANFT